MSYQPPLGDFAFLFEHLIDFPALSALPPFADLGLGTETAAAILAEAGKVAADVLAPINQVGDQQGARLENGRVVLPDVFDDAQRAMEEGGWMGLNLPASAGGQGLPAIFNTAVGELWGSANMAYSLCPTLTIGAANALCAHGTAQQIDTYVRPMAAGRWTGTMNLTEPQAGSDLSTIKTRAVANGDHYLITGQKIFITWGEHELAENIVHLVLARLPDAPAGTRGISLFVVPKFLVNADGTPRKRNDLRCIAVEHKMGIHASPTCVMSYGDEGGAVGYLVGEENQGLACMFTMMNEARLMVGVQGLAVAERARQKALAYARERVQGGTAIVNHPDVARMLMTQTALVEAMRAVAIVESANMDVAHHGDDAAAAGRVDLMIPVIKAWFTELGQEVASLCMQVHGGMGYIEETGVAQYLRDVRIAAIYEGTNGIQAADLVMRKLGRDNGQAMTTLLDAMAKDIATCGDGPLAAEADKLRQVLEAHREVTDVILAAVAGDVPRALFNSFDYLMATGYLCGGWQMLRALAAVVGGDDSAARARAASARFYIARLLPRATLHQQVCLDEVSIGTWRAALDA